MRGGLYRNLNDVESRCGRRGVMYGGLGGTSGDNIRSATEIYIVRAPGGNI